MAFKTLSLLPFALLLAQDVQAYNYGYGYNNRSGWHNIYIVAIVVPIIFILLCVLFWFCIFRAIFARRRQRRTEQMSYLPQTQQYPTSNSYNYSGNAGGMQQPAPAYQPGQQAPYNNDSYQQQQYAPPAGPPPTTSKWRRS